MSASESSYREYTSRRNGYDQQHERYRRSPPPPRGRNSHDGYRRNSSPQYSDRFEHHGQVYRDDRDYRDQGNRRNDTARGGYRDRDREGYRSPEYNRSRSSSRSRSRSPRGQRAGVPAKELILDGLAPDVNEEDVGINHPHAARLALGPGPEITTILKKDYNVAALEEVRVIRDKQTRQSRGFGFIKFPFLEEAEDFIQRYFPSIILSKDTSHSGGEMVKVRIAFSRERNLNDPSMDGDWTCQNCQFRNFAGRKACFKCQSRFSQAVQAEAKADFVNNGDSDVSINGHPSQFLVIRGLESGVTEDLLHKGVTKLFKPGANSGPLQGQGKKGKVSSTTGDANLGARESSLRRVLLIRDRVSNESWKYGFAEYVSIEDAQAALQRFNSFEKFTISSKPVFVSFIHPGVFVPVFDVTEEIEPFTFSPWGNSTVRLQYWDEKAYANELLLADPTASVSDENKTRSVTDKAVIAAQKEGIVAIGEEAEARSKKRKTESKEATKPKKSAPAHLEFWSNRHAELHGDKTKNVKAGDMNPVESKKIESADHSTTTTAKGGSSFVPSYSHPEKHCCYLCSRQFKSAIEVSKHEQASSLHKKNLENDELKAQAIEKMKKAGLSVQTEEGDADTPEYRDRARERRKAYGVSTIPSIKKISLPMKQQAEPVQPPVQSKGAALLGRMGWSSGEGLGAQGTGMTATIQTNVYAAGVGLGAQGGKLGDASEEADRNTKGGYAEFVERAKDKAKERYLNMQ